MKLLKALIFLVLLLFFLTPVNARDPWEPDTVLLQIENPQIPPIGGGDVKIKVLFWGDDTLFTVDCFFIPLTWTKNAILDPAKNTKDSVFAGTEIENWNIAQVIEIDSAENKLCLFGLRTSSTCDTLFGYRGFASLTFTLEDSSSITLDTTTYQPGGRVLAFSSFALNFTPKFKPAHFKITYTGPVKGDIYAEGVINLTDVMYFANYYFKGGPDPFWPESADVNCNGQINVQDLIYLGNFVLKSGPPPCPGQE